MGTHNARTLAGIARPSAALRKQIGMNRGDSVVSMEQLLNHTEAVNGLAILITEGIETVTTKDGRLDSKDLAAYILRRMKENQK